MRLTAVEMKSGAQVGPEYPAITAEVLSYDEVMKRFKPMMEWLAKLYMNTLNVIHYMHDKYSYERIEMALHDRDILRTMACGIAGLSVAADSLGAIKYAKVKPVRNEQGVAADFEIEESSLATATTMIAWIALPLSWSRPS